MNAAPALNSPWMQDGEPALTSSRPRPKGKILPASPLELTALDITVQPTIDRPDPALTIEVDMPSPVLSFEEKFFGRALFQQYFSRDQPLAGFARRLLAGARPELVLHAAWAEYEARGNLDRLAAAADLFAEIGLPSLASLKEIVATGRLEAECFVPAIAELRGASEAERTNLLLQLAQSHHVDVRRAVLAVLQPPSPVNPRLVLTLLAHDGDEEIAAEAQERLAHLR